MCMFCITLQSIKQVSLLSQKCMNSYPNRWSVRDCPYCWQTHHSPLFLCLVMNSNISQVVSLGDIYHASNDDRKQYLFVKGGIHHASNGRNDQYLFVEGVIHHASNGRNWSLSVCGGRYSSYKQWEGHIHWKRKVKLHILIEFYHCYTL